MSSNPYPVEPPGFFLGSLSACLLYGVHVAQVYTYFDTCKAASRYHRTLAVWVLCLSTLHMLVVWSSSYRYFVIGLGDAGIWGEFWWGLSVQDGLLYFGRRAWVLAGRRRWMTALAILPAITMAFGVAVWVINPWVTEGEMHSRPIGIPSQVVAIAWMGFSALTDGLLSAVLIWHFLKARGSSLWSTRRIAKRLISLTLETVLLTHLVGAAMCIIFLASPAQHRTKNNIFWFLLEIITELYALSILFTIIHHEAVRTVLQEPVQAPPVQLQYRDPSSPGEELWTPGEASTEVNYFEQSKL